MAGSGLTRRVLAKAMKDLMVENDLEKIRVTQICERSGVNRKSFYYHFKDKFDLVNWIFDTEIKEAVQKSESYERWDVLLSMLNYFFENRAFYRNALNYKGQNSFEEHFAVRVEKLIRPRVEVLLLGQEIETFYIDFLVEDVFLRAIERWLTSKNNIPPEEFLHKIRSMVYGMAQSICNEIEE